MTLLGRSDHIFYKPDDYLSCNFVFLRLFSLVLSRDLATMQMAFLLDPVVSCQVVLPRDMFQHICRYTQMLGWKFFIFPKPTFKNVLGKILSPPFDPKQKLKMFK